jgi:hypothetical protein
MFDTVLAIAEAALLSIEGLLGAEGADGVTPPGNGAEGVAEGGIGIAPDIKNLLNYILIIPLKRINFNFIINL